MAEYEQQAQDNTTRNIVIAVVVVIALCCCCLVAFILVGPLLLGPAVGNVFSNIIEGLELTPVP